MPLGDRCTVIGFPCPAPFESTPAADGYLHPLCGICTSWRHQRYVSQAADTTHEIKWDFIDPQVLNFLYIARADCITDLDTIEIEWSDDDVVYTPETSFSGPFDFTGPRDNDFFECFADTAAHRYWKVIINLTSSQVLQFSKIYTGELFDMGQEPVKPMTERRENRRSFLPFRTTAANIKRVRKEELAYEYRMRYQNITDAVAGQIMQLSTVRNNRFVLLANTTYTELFNNHDVLHGLITDVEITRVSADKNDVRFIFTEMIG